MHQARACRAASRSVTIDHAITTEPGSATNATAYSRMAFGLSEARALRCILHDRKCCLARGSQNGMERALSNEGAVEFLSLVSRQPGFGAFVGIVTWTGRKLRG